MFDTSPSTATNVDRITDFTVGDDTIQLSHQAFTALATGALAAGVFHIGNAATNAEEHIIYNSGTGALSYDADGSGAGAAVQFATLARGLALTHSDFIVT